jgi:hypothetical protein
MKMTGADPARQHHEAMLALQHEFQRKLSYHRQKAYHDPADIYWLAHDFLSALLQRSDNHHTEEELGKLLAELKHDFIALPQELVEGWHIFLSQLAYAQYGGYGLAPQHVQVLLDQCAMLIDETLQEIVTLPDDVTKELQTLRLFVQHGELDRAEEHYRAIIAKYEKLPDEKKQMHYPRITRAYATIAAARSAAPVSPQ